MKENEMDGIYRMFARWENHSPDSEISSIEEAVVEDTKNGAAELLNSQDIGRPSSVPKIDIEKGDFHVHLSPNKFNERGLIYARIGDEIVKIGYTDSQYFDNGHNSGVFHGNRGTLFQGVKEIFYAGTQEEVDEMFREWLSRKLAEKYPDDYSYEEKEETYESTTSNGIPYKISSGTPIKKRYLEAEIGGKKYVFSPYGFSQKGKNFSVWITPKSGKDNKTTFQLKRQTAVSAKNLQEAIEKMLRKIESLMKSSNKSKQGIISCINEYLV